MRDRNDAPTTAARKLYAANAASAYGKLDRIVALLAAHAKRQETRPSDWGFAGDLGHVVDSLDDLVAFLATSAADDDVEADREAAFAALVEALVEARWDPPAGAYLVGVVERRSRYYARVGDLARRLALATGRDVNEILGEACRAADARGRR